MKKQLICPRCKSTDISNDFSNAGMVATGLFNNRKKCNNCGYSSDFFPEIETN
jgi:ribosomal protein S27AE